MSLNGKSKERFERFLASCRPSASQYRAYRRRADQLMALHRARPLRLHSGSGGTSADPLELRSSVLFGQPYLVAWVDAAWLARTAPGRDALAEVEASIGTDHRPPLVLLPRPSRVGPSIVSQPMFEHEVVHINQTLRSAPGLLSKARRASSLHDYYFTVTRLEFQAGWLECTKWPATIAETLARHRAQGLTAQRWTLLQAHTQALERVLKDIITGHAVVPSAAVTEFLGAARDRASVALADLEVSARTMAWFRARWATDVYRALARLEAIGVELETSRLPPIAAWLTAQPEVVQMIRGRREAKRSRAARG